MNLPTTDTLVPCLGWTLVHFLWQGTCIAVWLWICLRLLRHGSANHRYAAGCMALTAIALAPVITFDHLVRQHLWQQPAAVAIIPLPASIEDHPLNLPGGPTKVVSLRLAPRESSLAQRLENALPFLVMGWVAGVVVLSARLLTGWWQVRRLKKIAVTPLGEYWEERLADLARRLSVSRTMRLVLSAMVEVPTVIGWLRPVILLPVGCLAGLSPAQLEAVLAHELAHIRRHDFLVNLMQSTLETLLFYHPAVWWVSRRIREEREHCCDDLALRVCGDRVVYARALATLEELRPDAARFALAAGGAPLIDRIRRLAGRPDKEVGRSGWLAAAIFTSTIAVVLALSLRGNRAVAQEQKPNCPATNSAPQVRIAISATTNSSMSGFSWTQGKSDGSETNPASRYLDTNLAGLHTATLVQEGKLLFEMGKLPGAEAKLKQALKEDPANAAARYYINAIAERRNEDAQRRADMQAGEKLLIPLAPVPAEDPNIFNRTNPSYTSTGRRTILSKLDRIRLDTVKYDGWSLDQVVNDLNERARSLDPDKTGVNFFINRQVPGTGTIDPTTGLPIAQTPTGAVDIGNAITIKISPGLNDLRLADALDAITKCADKPANIPGNLAYSIEDYAVVFSIKPGAAQLYTRVYHVDPNTFKQGLEGVGSVPFANVALQNGGGSAGGAGASIPRVNVTDTAGARPSGSGSAGAANGQPLAISTNGISELQAQVRNFFIAAGVDLNPANPFNVGKSIFYNDRNGTLMAHATLADLDRIESAVQTCNRPLSGVQGGSSGVSMVNGLINLINNITVKYDHAVLTANHVLINTNNGTITADGSVWLQEEGRNAMFDSFQLYYLTAGWDDQQSNTGRVSRAEFSQDGKRILTIEPDGTIRNWEAQGARPSGSAPPPPQVNIKAVFVEMDDITNQLVGLNWILPNPFTRAPVFETNPPVRRFAPTRNDVRDAIHTSNSVLAQYTGVMSGAESRRVMEALKKCRGVDTLTSPEVTTGNRRQAQMQISEMQSVVTGINPAETGTNRFQVKALPFGSTLDVIPSVSDDGRSIQMALDAAVTEFLGYDDPRASGVTNVNGSVVPLPRYRLREIGTASTTVKEGETIVLGGIVAESVNHVTDKVPLLGDIPLLGHLFRSQSSTKTRKNLLVFVTPTLINPDGTPYHPGETGK